MRYSPSFFRPAKWHLQSAKCQQTLQRIAASNASPQTLLSAAEALRSAKLAEFKAQTDLITFGGRAPDTIPPLLSEITVQITKWQSIPANEIIKRYT